MPATTAPKRNASLDALRVVALAGVVTLHTAGGGFAGVKPLGFVLDELGRFAVPTFFLLSAWFWKPAELEQPLRLIGRVAMRTLPAFVFWLAIYYGWDAIQHPDHRPDLSSWWLIAWSGGEPAFHLWFLPALVVGTAIVAMLGRYLGWRITLAISLALFLIGVVIGSYAKVFGLPGIEFWKYRNGIFFAPVFLVAGVLLRRRQERIAELPVAWLVAGVVIFAALQVAEGWLLGRYPGGHDFGLATLGYGIFPSLLFARLELRNPLWTTLGRASFTAYLVHLLVLSQLVRLLGNSITSLLVIVLCIAISLAIGVGWQAFRGALRSNRPPARRAAG